MTGSLEQRLHLKHFREENSGKIFEDNLINCKRGHSECLGAAKGADARVSVTALLCRPPQMNDDTG